MPAEERKSGDAFLRNCVFSRTLNELQELGRQQKDGRKGGLAIDRVGQGTGGGKEGGAGYETEWGGVHGIKR